MNNEMVYWYVKWALGRARMSLSCQLYTRLYLGRRNRQQTEQQNRNVKTHVFGRDFVGPPRAHEISEDLLFLATGNKSLPL